jgi:hypothetical protein
MALPTQFKLNYNDEIVTVNVYESNITDAIVAIMNDIAYILHKIDDYTYTDGFITISTKQ